MHSGNAPLRRHFCSRICHAPMERSPLWMPEITVRYIFEHSIGYINRIHMQSRRIHCQRFRRKAESPGDLLIDAITSRHRGLPAVSRPRLLPNKVSTNQHTVFAIFEYSGIPPSTHRIRCNGHRTVIGPCSRVTQADSDHLLRSKSSDRHDPWLVRGCTGQKGGYGICLPAHTGYRGGKDRCGVSHSMTAAKILFTAGLQSRDRPQ